jgi:hypothetical protein
MSEDSLWLKYALAQTMRDHETQSDREPEEQAPLIQHRDLLAGESLEANLFAGARLHSNVAPHIRMAVVPTYVCGYPYLLITPLCMWIYPTYHIHIYIY